MLLTDNRPRLLLACAVCLPALLIVVAWAGTLQRLSAEKTLLWQNASSQQSNLVEIVSENLLQVFDQARLMAIAAEPWFDGNRAATETRLSAMSAVNRTFLQVSLYDQQLNQVYSSSPSDVSSRQIMALHRAMADLDPASLTLVGPAMLGDISENKWEIPLLFPVAGRQNSQSGTLLVVLDLGYFLSLYQNIEMGDSGIIHVLKDTGETLFKATPAGLLASSQHQSVLQLPDTPGGRTHLTTGDLLADGDQYLSSYRRPTRFPIIIAVSQSVDEILLAHETMRKRVLVSLASMTALMILAIYLFARSLVRQGQLVTQLQTVAHEKHLLIDQLKAEKHRAFELAAHDHLTGLPNRRMFGELVNSHIARAKRTRKHCAMLYLDLDRFKWVNDTLGHHIGDLLLQNIAVRLRSILRESDVIARLGGDEFAILLTDLDKESDAQRIAANLVEKLAQPYPDLGGHTLHSTPSIGIAYFPRHGRDMDTLCRYADAAMYASKRGGRGKFTVYDEGHGTTDDRRLNLERLLPISLRNDEFLLHFQPKVSLVNYEIAGFEALVRWQHPELGLLQPRDFIPLIERTGQAQQFGSWVVEACCRQIVAWRKQGIRPVPIAFNASARQLHDVLFATKLERLLGLYGIEAGMLEIEITESGLIESTEAASKTLAELKELSMTVTLDDFGTGFSRLGYIRDLPIDNIKIDREFINDIRNSPYDAVIVTSIISMAHNLGMHVVAEGVEFIEQLVHLKTAGCDYAQGYLFSRAVPADAACKLLLHTSLTPT